jgi:hypothetical protein
MASYANPKTLKNAQKTKNNPKKEKISIPILNPPKLLPLNCDKQLIFHQSNLSLHILKKPPKPTF